MCPDGKEKSVELPVGVDNENVKEVLVIDPKSQEIKNKDKGVNSKEVLDILKGKK